MLPMYNALPEKYRGDFYAKGKAGTFARDQGVQTVLGPPRNKSLVCVASYEDHRAVKPSSTILVNHGIGQTYSSNDVRGGPNHPCYSGGRDRERVVLHLAPSERVAEIDRTTNPWATSVAIGTPCYLDALINSPRVEPTHDVCFTTHADIYVTQESRSAWAHYEEAIRRFIDTTHLQVLGHAHPRNEGKFTNLWGRWKVEYERDLVAVLQKTRLFIFDNSSSGFEAAALDIPVLLLDAPWYRPDINHGGRFWDFADVGVRIQDPHDLPTAIALALEDAPLLRKRRQKVISEAYTGLLDGKSTDRAVSALIELSETYGR